MAGRYAPHVRRLRESVFRGPGMTAPALRAVIGERARRVVCALPAASADGESAGPPSLEPYLDTVIRHAYKVSDADVQRLKGTGHSDDHIFEVTVAAAVGAGVSRLDRALALLKERG